MQSRHSETREGFWLARDNITAGRYRDAIRTLEWILDVPSLTHQQLLAAKYSIAECLRLTGRCPEALAHYGEIFVAVKDQPAYRPLAWESYVAQVDTLRMIEDARYPASCRNYAGVSTLILDGLSWLRNASARGWQAAILLCNADVLLATGDRTQALDVAEEAYQLRKQCNAPGWSLSAHAHRVVRLCRMLKSYERASVVLDEVDGKADNTLMEVRLLGERARVLLANRSSTASDALAVARRCIVLADPIQCMRDRMLSFCHLAVCCVAAGSYDESLTALYTARSIAREDGTGDRQFLWGILRDCLVQFCDALLDNTNAQTVGLSRTATYLLEDASNELGMRGVGLPDRNGSQR